jgi:hypothetical protein
METMDELWSAETNKLEFDGISSAIQKEKIKVT